MRSENAIWRWSGELGKTKIWRSRRAAKVKMRCCKKEGERERERVVKVYV